MFYQSEKNPKDYSISEQDIFPPYYYWYNEKEDRLEINEIIAEEKNVILC